MSPDAVPDDAFLTAIEQHPIDDTARLVYADWLDEHGRSAAAAFLRLEVRLRHHAPGAPGWFALCRGFLTSARATPDDWRARVSRPRLVGTTWRGVGTASEVREQVTFEPGSVLVYREAACDDEGEVFLSDDIPGKWRQFGPRVVLIVNDFSIHRGTIRGNRMPLRGRALDRDKVFIQYWTLTRVPGPECIPDVR